MCQAQPATLTFIPYAKSRVEVDWTCKRKRYWSYEYDDTGLDKVGASPIELVMGSCLHDGLAAIAHGLPIDDIAKAGYDQMQTGIMEAYGGVEDFITLSHEQAALVEGILRGFHKHAWPLLLQQYPNIFAIEEPIIYPHDLTGNYCAEGPFAFFTKPDLLLEDKEGNLFYIEYKSTSANHDAWINSWQTAVQVHSVCRAVKHHFKRDVAAVIVQGLYKGYHQYNKQNSPYCYAYHRPGNPPFSKHEFRYDYAAGFKKYPTWLMPGAVKGWVGGMPSQMLTEQFPQTPPIFYNEDQITAYFAQRAMREAEISAAAKALVNKELDQEKRNFILDMSFPQDFSQCQVPTRQARICPFKQLCFGDPSNPLEAGFRKRSARLEKEIAEWQDKQEPNYGALDNPA